MYFISQFQIFVCTLLASTMCLADIIGHNLLCPGTPRNLIPGTNLETHTFYTVRLKRFPEGAVTWTNQVHSSGSRFMQTDNGGSLRYQKNGDWYFDSQWIFIPSKFHEGWYHLVNRGIPGEYASFINSDSPNNGVNQNKYYVLLNPNFSPQFSTHQNDEFLWKPVQQNGGEYYQLISKALPNTPVTWTEKKYLKNGHYIQLDNTRDPKYEYGGEWFEDTLFSFHPEDETVRLNASIFKVELLDGFIDESRGDHEVQTVDLGNEVTYKNVGSSSIITQSYSAKGQVIERILLDRSPSLVKAHTLRVERGMEVVTQGNLTFITDSALRSRFVDIYSFQSSAASSNVTENLSIEKAKIVSVNQRIEIPPRTKYLVKSFVKMVKNYPIEYVIQFRVSATTAANDEIPEEILRTHLLDEGIEYISTLDEYTVVAQVRGKLRATFAVNTVINSYATPIQECYAPCEQQSVE